MTTVLYHKNLEALHQLEKLLLASGCATVIKCDAVLCYAVKEKTHSHCLKYFPMQRRLRMPFIRAFYQIQASD